MYINHILGKSWTIYFIMFFLKLNTYIQIIFFIKYISETKGVMHSVFSNHRPVYTCTYMYTKIYSHLNTVLDTKLLATGLPDIAPPTTNSGGSRICEKGGPGIHIPQCRARPEKYIFFSPEFFFASFTLLGRGTIRLPDRPPWWQAKNNKKLAGRKKIGRKKGGRAWIRHWLIYMQIIFQVLNFLCHRLME